jgi:DMSO/TMAO reductase YedYZ molybdopterin-dependent catalytic subunit
VFSRREPRGAQHLLRPPVDLLQRELSRHLRSRQAYPRSAISPFHWVNGRPPTDAEYEHHSRHKFVDWELRVDGLVDKPLRLKLPDLAALPVTSQVVKHNCIQGWSAVAEWTGVSVSELLRLAGPLPAARYVAIWSVQNPASNGCRYYECVDLELALGPQCILAYSMNGDPLPVVHGAPLRLRVENQLGFKMVKWVRRLELVDDFRQLGEGQGGWREDHMQYSRLAGI